MTQPDDHVAHAEVVIAAPPRRVWVVLTEPGEISTWMPGTTVASDWREGSAITWSGEYGGTAFEDKGEILEIVENERLRMTHYSPLSDAEDTPENYHVVDYRLTPEGDGTRLVLEQGGNESAEQAEQFSANWQQMLEGAKHAAESPSGS
jgi:uncharacterized protein YndB with AHSA1/START domain